MRRILFGILLAVSPPLWAASLAAHPTAECEASIARHLEWRGGNAFASVGSLRRSGLIEVAGLSGPLTVTQTRDGRQRLEADLSVIRVVEVLLPEASWLLNPSGQVEDMGSVPETNARRAYELEWGLPLFDSTANVTCLDDERKDGVTWGVIRVAYDDGDSHDLLIDEQTGALTWVRVRQDTETYWLQYEDWTVVEGVRLPGVTRELHDNSARNTVYAWAETLVNAPIPDLTFTRPTAERRVVIAGGASSTGWIPFDFFRRERVFLPAQLNGVATEVILDSGAEMTAVDVQVAEAAALAGAGTVVAEGTGGTTEVQLATGATLSIGSVELRDLTIAIIDLAELGRRILGRSLSAILGKEVFNETVVDIDYPNRRIAFHDPEQWSYTGDGVVVPLRELADSRAVEISIEGGEPILVSFDIGQGSALTLFEDYVEASGLLEERRTSTRLGGGVGGEVVSIVSTLRTVSFGGVDLHDVPVTFSIDAEGSFDTRREQGNLGTGIFSRFRMIVNYSRDELYLEPDMETIRRGFDHDRAGLQLEITEGSARVRHVMTGSPAETAGLVTDDVVTSINGRPVSQDYWSGDQWRWAYEPAGTSASLTLADGREVTLTLADFH